MDFILHLKQSVAEGKLVVGYSTLQDWFSLLSLEDINELVVILEELLNDESENSEYLIVLVDLLCEVEGFDSHKHYEENVTPLLAEFLCMANLELLSRQGYIRLLKKLSFTDQGDFKIELLKSPPGFGFIRNLDMNMN